MNEVPTVTSHRTMGGMTVYATYSGCAYIDLSWDPRNETAFEVINVWDHAAGKAGGPIGHALETDYTESDKRQHLKRAVSTELREWLRETGTAELRNYWEHTAPGGRWS